MRVCIAGTGRFHMFDLARQMEQLGHLAGLYTGYPRFKIKELPRKKINTFPWFVAPYMALGRIGVPALKKFDHLIDVRFDNWTSRNLVPCDIYHCLSGVGLRTHQIARERYGARTVCDRASTHIRYQDRILHDEFDAWGIPYPGTDARIIDRELAEYEICDLIAVPSSIALRSFTTNGVPAHKLRKNPFGVNPVLFKPVPKIDDVFRVLFVGQIGLRKGVVYLLEAIAHLKLPRFELCLIGSVLPEFRDLLARYEGSFRYVGAVPHGQLYRWYSQASVLVLPSIEEGLAYVQAEAMACGVPVIATGNTGAEDLFTDGVEGFIVPIRDSEAIRNKVLSLYREPELLQEMSRAALRRARTLGGWNDFGERALRIYEQQLRSVRSAEHQDSPMRGQLG